MRVSLTSAGPSGYSFTDFLGYLNHIFKNGSVSNPTPTSFTHSTSFGGQTVTAQGTGTNFTWMPDPPFGFAPTSGKIEDLDLSTGATALGLIANLSLGVKKIETLDNRDETVDSCAIEKYLLRQDYDFTGSAAADVLKQGDTLGAGCAFNPRGDDIFRLKGGADDWFAGAGADRVFAGAGADIVFGGGGDDILRGQNGRDTLNGGAGSDVLDGGNQNDRLKGGAASDTFRFADGYGNDRALDFTPGTDRIDLSGLASIGNFAQLLNATSDTANGAQIVDGGDSLLLKGVAKAALLDADFIY